MIGAQVFTIDELAGHLLIVFCKINVLDAMMTTCIKAYRKLSKFWLPPSGLSSPI